MDKLIKMFDKIILYIIFIPFTYIIVNRYKKNVYKNLRIKVINLDDKK